LWIAGGWRRTESLALTVTCRAAQAYHIVITRWDGVVYRLDGVGRVFALRLDAGGPTSLRRRTPANRYAVSPRFTRWRRFTMAFDAHELAAVRRAYFLGPGQARG
jgi:hypothetical protein